MEIQQGYSYHIKDEFFDLVQDKYLMSNKEQGNYHPHYYAIQDRKNPKLYWMIPISSQAEKYKGIIEKKKKRYGKCNTIVIGSFAGKENAFLIQNTFPSSSSIIFLIAFISVKVNFIPRLYIANTSFRFSTSTLSSFLCIVTGCS